MNWSKAQRRRSDTSSFREPVAAQLMATPRELLAERLKLALASKPARVRFPRLFQPPIRVLATTRATSRWCWPRETEDFAAAPRGRDLHRDRTSATLRNCRTVAEPGFINFRLTDSFLAREAAAIRGR